ncbi:peptide chain release factor N(5)-glutamine methyltransferase [Croceicoccus sp. F390]|uniref:Release factor glutamine methyltransferase n=1 Tax=Croceicoccus esteveae TaxID=3075597 RepID=A0ABU2ZDA6_9SPHN|nr:peptide chain release factor N(5)-glutamine methyltransferase [Croceicoccus sp. F390]MDT0574588.1 peptide chain release factor N(5)-glutamine methyltransferase [Croceicoccus sp. F390]
MEGDLRIAAALRDAAGKLAAIAQNPRLDAEWIMAQALGVTRSALLLDHLDGPAPQRFGDLVARRLAGEPLAYILGRQSFWGLEFAVTRHVLVPRSDSEVLLEVARQVLADRPPQRILDLGIGSGALLLAALHIWPQAQGIGIDKSGAALAIAQHNAEQLGLAARATLRLADWNELGWQQKIPAAYDLVLANPPYVADDDPDLADDVRRYEPEGALFAGSDGLDAYRMLIPQLPDLLVPGGIAMIEIGSRQAAATQEIAAQSQMQSRLHHDLSGHARALELWTEKSDMEEKGLAVREIADNR